MKHREHTPEQVVRKLREAEKLAAEGANVPTICRHIEVSEQTYHRWRRQYANMTLDDVRQLEDLKKENARLKQIVADQALDVAALKDVAQAKF